MGDWFTPSVWMDTNFTTLALFTQSSLKTSRSWSTSIWMCSYTWIVMSGTRNHLMLWCLVQGQCKRITKSIPVYAQSSYLVFVIQHVQHMEDCHFIKHFSKQSVETTLSDSNIQLINSLEIMKVQQFDKDSAHSNISPKHHL